MITELPKRIPETQTLQLVFKKKVHKKPEGSFWYGLNDFFKASELGYALTLPIVLGAIFGLWLDNKYLTRPKFTLIGLTIGIVLSLSRLYIIIRKYLKK